jgi:hypothetical protein
MFGCRGASGAPLVFALRAAGMAAGLSLAPIGCAGAELSTAAPGALEVPTLDEPDARVEFPAATASADASGGIVLLRAPAPRQDAERVVRAFFEAIRHESIRDLGAVLSDDATLLTGTGSAAESVPKVWAARFKRLDYGFSGAKSPYRSDELGFFTAEELRELRSVRRFELAPEAGELLGVVTTRDRLKVEGPRHFGRKIEFVLGETPEGLRIRRIFEDFRLP